MKNRFKLAVFTLLASLMLVSGMVGLATQPAAAATAKQLAVHCGSGYVPGELVHVSGFNQNFTFSSGNWAFNGSGYAYTVDWWWLGQPDGYTVNLLIPYDGRGQLDKPRILQSQWWLWVVLEHDPDRLLATPLPY